MPSRNPGIAFFRGLFFAVILSAPLWAIAGIIGWYIYQWEAR